MAEALYWQIIEYLPTVAPTFGARRIRNRYLLADMDGATWGVYEFLERYVGARWYFPEPDIGLSIPPSRDLIVPAVHLTDAPVFPMRVIWPDCSDARHGCGTMLRPLHTFLRKGNSWPNELVVHSPDWSRFEDYTNRHPEVFQGLWLCKGAR